MLLIQSFVFSKIPKNPYCSGAPPEGVAKGADAAKK